VLVAAQDPNVSFNGAECLRIFREKVKEHHSIFDPRNQSNFLGFYIVMLFTPYYISQ
jgi:hypothetical protein